MTDKNKPYSIGDVVWVEWHGGTTVIGGYFYDFSAIKPCFICEIDIDGAPILFGFSSNRMGNAEAYGTKEDFYRTFKDARRSLGMNHGGNIVRMKKQMWQDDMEMVLNYRKKRIKEGKCPILTDRNTEYCQP